MRLRIAAAIVVCVAFTLLACGAAVYYAAQSVLLADLDESLLARAASRPELVDSTGAHSEADHPLELGDRYVIKAAADHRTLFSSHRDRDSAPPAQVELVGSGEFGRLADGQVVRTVTVRGFARPAADQPPLPVIITFSGSTEHYFAMLRRLRWVVILGGIAGCAVAAGVAWVLAGAALRPLRATADVIGTIDERSLNRRIETEGLPNELAPVAQTLNSMLEGLEQAVRRRKQFMADAAHELRTPVAALMTELEVALRRQRTAEAYRATLESCLGEARFLRRLVEALLAQARSEAASPPGHGIGPSLQPVDVVSVARECVALLRPIADERGVRLVLSADPEVPRSSGVGGATTTATAGVMPAGPMVLASPVRLRSVLVNLLSNAIEYNRVGGVARLAVDAAPVGDPAKVRLSVSDDGIGIGPEHLPRVFEPFYRADPARRKDEHLGLGLFLVQSHVQAMGGTIDLATTPGEGTTFTVTLPTVAAATPAAERAEPAQNVDVSRSSHPIPAIMTPSKGVVESRM